MQNNKLAHKIKLTLLIPLFVSLLTYFLPAQPDTTPNKIYIKFKPTSEIFKKFEESGEIDPDFLAKLISSNFTIKPMINPQLLDFIERKLKNTTPHIPPQKISLKRIFQLELKSDVDAKLISQKLSSIDDFEYVELAPIHRFFFIPNDSLLFRQYYLGKIKVFEAWDELNNGDTIIVGIVDTGIDYEHEDLSKNIYINPGEIGKDNQGRDKRSNGIDDDNNGFIDDWHGWDFVGSGGTSGDNDPFPGHSHGTHVAGTVGAIINNKIGVAGIAPNVKLLPIKVSRDSPSAYTVENGFEGILYASAMGCRVINCSWGSATYSKAEQEVIDHAIALGSVIISAGGNDGRELKYYPAGYNGVLSVTSVDYSDTLSYFANYDNSIGISAPGENIYNTIPGNYYQSMNGTSMSAPIVSGVAAMVCQKFPHYTSLQVIEHLKATSDNIDSLNPYYAGKIGRGRVNALRALTADKAKSIVLSDYSIVEEFLDNSYQPGELIKIYVSLTNVLSPIENCYMKISSKQLLGEKFDTDSIFIGNLASLENISITEPIQFKIPINSPINYNITISMEFFDTTDYINSDHITIYVNPSYRTMAKNNIKVTFNSIGNIGYNDYPQNMQGEGFIYKSGNSLLFEGGLMVAVAPDKISDVVRSAEQSRQNNAFILSNVIKLNEPGTIADLESISYYSDKGLSTEANVSVSQQVYQFNQQNYQDFVISTYTIKNKSDENFDSLHVGLYFDWDIGPAGSYNQAIFDNQYGFGYVKNVVDNTLPMAGVLLLSPFNLNFYAIDNDGETLDNIGVYNGFTYTEKWITLSSGIERKISNVKDVSFVIGAGPIKLFRDDSVTIAFSFFAGYGLEQLRQNAVQSIECAQKYNLAHHQYFPIPEKDTIYEIFPNPITNNDLTIVYAISNNTYVHLTIYDLLGNCVQNLVNWEFRKVGKYSHSLSLSHYSPGVYFIHLRTYFGQVTKPFIIIRE